MVFGGNFGILFKNFSWESFQLIIPLHTVKWNYCPSARQTENSPMSKSPQDRTLLPFCMWTTMLIKCRMLSPCLHVKCRVCGLPTETKQFGIILMKSVHVNEAEMFTDKFMFQSLIHTMFGLFCRLPSSLCLSLKSHNDRRPNKLTDVSGFEHCLHATPHNKYRPMINFKTFNGEMLHIIFLNCMQILAASREITY